MKILLISLLLVFAAPAVAQTVTMGDTKIEATADSGNANILTLQPATLSTAATLNSLSFYVATASGKLSWAFTIRAVTCWRPPRSSRRSLAGILKPQQHTRPWRQERISSPSSQAPTASSFAR